MLQATLLQHQLVRYSSGMPSTNVMCLPSLPPCLHPQGLEDQLLGEVVRKERPDLEEAKDRLVVSISGDKKQLQDLEDKILKLLKESTGRLAGIAACHIMLDLKLGYTAHLDVSAQKGLQRDC